MKLLKVWTEAIMGAQEYQPPASGPQLIADFYTLEQLKPPITRFVVSHHRDLLQQELEQAEAKLLPHLKQHLISYAGYSIICELRHCIDAASPTEMALQRITQNSNDPKMQASVQLWLRLINQGQPGHIQYYDAMNPSQHYHHCTISLEAMKLSGVPASIISLYDASSSYSAWWDQEVDFGQKAYPLTMARPDRAQVWSQINTNDLATACAVGVRVFDDKAPARWFAWHAAFGAEPWVEASKSVSKLMAANTAGDIIVTADHIFDLQHNSGNLLDKNPEYDGKWVSAMLDLKRDADSPDQVAYHASPFIRKLCNYALRELYGRSNPHGERGSNRMSNDFCYYLAKQFKTYIQRKGLITKQNSYNNVADLGVYNQDEPTTPFTDELAKLHAAALHMIDKLGEVNFVRDRVLIKYKPEASIRACGGKSQQTEPTTDYYLNKQTEILYAEHDFEAPDGFDIILNLLTTFPTGRQINELLVARGARESVPAPEFEPIDWSMEDDAESEDEDDESFVWP